jgi:hypothetical protein
MFQTTYDHIAKKTKCIYCNKQCAVDTKKSNELYDMLFGHTDQFVESSVCADHMCSMCDKPADRRCLRYNPHNPSNPMFCTSHIVPILCGVVGCDELKISNHSVGCPRHNRRCMGCSKYCSNERYFKENEICGVCQKRETTYDKFLEFTTKPYTCIWCGWIGLPECSVKQGYYYYRCSAQSQKCTRKKANRNHPKWKQFRLSNN